MMKKGLSTKRMRIPNLPHKIAKTELILYMQSTLNSPWPIVRAPLIFILIIILDRHMETLPNLSEASKINSSEANFSGLYWEAKEERNAIYNPFIYMAITRLNSFGILQVNKFHFKY